MLERVIQHLYLTMEGPAYHHVKKAQHSHLTMGGSTFHHVRKAQHLHPTMGGLAYTMSERLSTYI